MDNRHNNTSRIAFGISKKGVLVSVILTVGLFLIKVALTNFFRDREIREARKEQLMQDMGPLPEPSKERMQSLLRDSDEPFMLTRPATGDSATYTIVTSETGRVEMPSSGNTRTKK